MKVHIKSKYCLREEDVHLLKGQEQKMMWWMKCDDEGGQFIRFDTPQKGTKPLDVDVDIQAGRYSAGCGVWDVKNSSGRSVYQRLYFYVTPDGTVIYVDKKADMPSLKAIMEMGDESDYIENTATKSDSDKTEVEVKMEPLDFIYYCNFPRDRVEGDTDEMHELRKIKKNNDTHCTDFLAIKKDNGYKCDNCVYAQELYIIK